MEETIKVHIFYIVTILIVSLMAAWGWFTVGAAQSVGRGDLREAGYLVSEFTTFCHESGHLPDSGQAESFESRLEFVELKDGHYIYRCGLYRQDTFEFYRDENGLIQFLVFGN